MPKNINMTALHYTYIPLYGFFYHMNGVIDYQSRIDYQNKKYQPTKKEEPALPYADMHRWVTRQANNHEGIKDYLLLQTVADTTRAFRKVVQKFTENYGDFFTDNIYDKSYKEHRVLDWYEEWKTIGEAVQKGEPDPKHLVTTKYQTLNETAIVIDNWRSWCWLLIARDTTLKITYLPCQNHEQCGHEVPSLSLSGEKGESYCSEECRNR